MNGTPGREIAANAIAYAQLSPDAGLDLAAPDDLRAARPREARAFLAGPEAA